MCRGATGSTDLCDPDTIAWNREVLPKVSIIVTCYNYERFVEEAIRSVSAQTYTNLECVIIDDCSQDSSFAVITRLLDDLNLPHFRAIRLGENSGQMLAFRAGLENSNGHFVTFLDADDVLAPTFVEKHVAAHLNSFKSAAMTASDTLTIDDAGAVIEGTFFQFGTDPTFNIPTIDVPGAAIPNVGLGSITYSRNSIGPSLKFRDPARWGWPFSATSSFMFRRDVLRLAITPTTDKIRICADGYLVQIASALSGSILIFDQLSSYRHHATNNYIGGFVIGGWRRPRIAHFGELLDSVSSVADEVVRKDYERFKSIAFDHFFEFFPSVKQGMNTRETSKLKRVLEGVWTRLPRALQQKVMPLADWIDRNIK